jgi:hypothetical protein
MCALANRLPDGFRAVTDNHHRRFGAGFTCGTQRMLNHRQTTKGVQHLRKIGFHARALASGKQNSSHSHMITPLPSRLPVSLLQGRRKDDPGQIKRKGFAPAEQSLSSI